MKKRFSLLTDDMSKCYITGSTQDIHIHEVYFGTADRKKSIEYGCCVPLRADYHNMSSHGVHFNKDLDLRLKNLIKTTNLSLPRLIFLLSFLNTISYIIKKI